MTRWYCLLVMALDMTATDDSLIGMQRREGYEDDLRSFAERSDHTEVSPVSISPTSARSSHC